MGRRHRRGSVVYYTQRNGIQEIIKHLLKPETNQLSFDSARGLGFLFVFYVNNGKDKRRENPPLGYKRKIFHYIFSPFCSRTKNYLNSEPAPHVREWEGKNGGGKKGNRKESNTQRNFVLPLVTIFVPENYNTMASAGSFWNVTCFRHQGERAKIQWRS